MTDPTSFVDPLLRRTLKAAGLPAKGDFQSKAGWVSRAWVRISCLLSGRNHRDGLRW